MDMRVTPAGLPAAPAGETLLRSVRHGSSGLARMVRKVCENLLYEDQDGQSETFSVEPGSHSVRLKLDWTRSETVNVTVLEGSVVNLKCGPRGGSFTLLPDVLLRPGSYLRLEASD